MLAEGWLDKYDKGITIARHYLVMISVMFAGRSAKEANLYTEIAEGIHAYGITRHRHGTNYFMLSIP